HFINDVGGSICELDDDEVTRILTKHTMILYIKASKEDEQELIHRAETDPKPLYYREEFLDEQLAIYKKENNIDYVALIDPDEFVRWIFPKLFYSRIPRYEAIADQYGYTVTTRELYQVRDEADFLELLATAVGRQSSP
ncbi:MAG: ATPase, partial [Gammaproteobacteria bacterium]